MRTLRVTGSVNIEGTRCIPYGCLKHYFKAAPAKHVKKLSNFYVQLFRLSITHSEAEKVVLESEAYQLTIHSIPEDIAETIAISKPPQLRENTSIKLFFPVEGLSATRKKAYNLGGGLSPSSTEWSAGDFRACDGFDPEGNVVQFRENTR